MNHLLLITLLAFYVPAAQAQSLISHILDAPKMLETSTNICVEETDPRKQCVKDLCPKKPGFPGVIQNDELEEVMDGIEGELVAEKLAQIEKHVNQKVKNFQDKIAEMQKQTPAEMLKTVHKDARVDYSVRNFYYKCQGVVDQAMPVDSRLTLKCPEDLNHHPLKQHFQARLTELVQKNLSVAVFYNFFPTAELEARAPAYFESLRQLLETYKKNNLAYYEQYLAKLPAEWAKFDGLNSTQKEAMIRDSGTLITITNADYCNAEICSTYLEEVVVSSKFKHSLQELLNTANDPLLAETAKASYRVQARLERFGVKPVEMEAFNQHKNDAIAEILAYQKKHMSSHSYAVYKADLEKVEILTDLAPFNTTELAKYDVKPSVNEIIRLAQSKPGALLNEVDSTLGSPIVMLSDSFQGADYSKPEPRVSKNKVYVSIFSVKNPEYGKQVFIHELGHHLSHMHNSKQLSESTGQKIIAAKQCLTNRYEKFKQRTGKDAGNWYLEEEFADEYNFAITKKPATNIFCAMMGISDASDFELDFLKSRDRHPTPLWRILNHMQRLGDQTPNSCQQLIDKEAANYLHQDCL